MQRQHLPLQSGSRFREARRNFWHDLPRIIDQGSKTPSRVPFLLVLDTTSCRRGRRSPQPDMIRKGRHYNAGCGGGSPEQRNVHAPRNGARERESAGAPPLLEVDCITFLRAENRSARGRRCSFRTRRNPRNATH